ncbi:MAG: aminotransferase class V-fold PLP-dependent enzyme [Bryobacteraceae bacterium]|nr:aminotransferase class V-fold PLP-dependent enzyme [Bryobacteraceae bacterium]
MPEGNWEEIRSRFPALAQVTYLNTATYGQTSNATFGAVRAHFDRRNAHACSDFLSWFADIDRIRAKTARLINAPSGDDIAFCTTASAALSWLINGLEWKSGDRVIALSNEFPNNSYFPSTLSRFGVEYIESDWEDLDRHLNAGPVRAVFLSTVNYANGFRPVLDGLAERVHRAGGLLYLDGTQSVGAVQFDVERWRPDMLSVNAYKWMNSPNGAGFAYVAPALRAALHPSVVGWRSDQGWRRVDHLHHGEPVFVEAAERFEGGMLDFPSLYGFEASVDLVLELGADRVEARVLDLAAQCCSLLEEFGGNIAHQDSAIVAAEFPGVDASALARELKTAGILVSARHGRLRVSTHFYNNEADLSLLRSALSGLIR